ncbi:hypothetical protein [Pseudorhodobacter wandonensis]|uniref:hypothetical protein n=1 Tax=Pseudorhodobacter wandonensis TaxID=1120568 RepID=UPI00067D58DF|nr:hypothetical protein [Pseudorhodobacter wandonensis]
MSEPLMEKAAFLEGLEARSKQFLQRLNDKEGNISEAYIALDLMRAMASAHNGGISSDEILAALPVKAWREDTVPIPFAFLRTLAMGWAEYLGQQNVEGGKTLGHCFELEGRFQGAKGIARKAKTRDQLQRLAKLVVIEILFEESAGRHPKLMAAIKKVSVSEGKSEATVRNAYRRFGRSKMSEYREAVKTS